MLKTSSTYGQIIILNLQSLLLLMPNEVLVVNEPKSMKTPKYKNSREILKLEKQNHQSFVSIVYRAGKNVT